MLTKSVKSFKEMGNVLGLSELIATPVPKPKKTAQKKSAKKACPDDKSVLQHELLDVYEGVVFKIPGEKGMEYKPAFIAENGDSVSPHWHQGRGLGLGVFLNINFYKMTQKELGKKRVTTVNVLKKIMSDGRKFIILDVIDTPEKADECRYDFKMPVDGTGDFEIDPRIKTRIYFKPRRHNRLYSQNNL